MEKLRFRKGDYVFTRESGKLYPKIVFVTEDVKYSRGTFEGIAVSSPQCIGEEGVLITKWYPDVFTLLYNNDEYDYDSDFDALDKKLDLLINKISHETNTNN